MLQSLPIVHLLDFWNPGRVDPLENFNFLNVTRFAWQVKLRAIVYVTLYKCLPHEFHEPALECSDDPTTFLVGNISKRMKVREREFFSPLYFISFFIATSFRTVEYCTDISITFCSTQCVHFVDYCNNFA